MLAGHDIKCFSLRGQERDCLPLPVSHVMTSDADTTPSTSQAFMPVLICHFCVCVCIHVCCVCTVDVFYVVTGSKGKGVQLEAAMYAPVCAELEM